MQRRLDRNAAQDAKTHDVTVPGRNTGKTALEPYIGNSPSVNG
jgi:hypothetical protein